MTQLKNLFRHHQYHHLLGVVFGFFFVSDEVKREDA